MFRTFWPRKNTRLKKLRVVIFVDICKQIDGTASSKSIEMFWCMWNRARPLGLPSVIVVLKNGLIWHRAKAFISASHDVTGTVHNNLRSVEILGKNLLSHLLRAFIGLSGNWSTAQLTNFTWGSRTAKEVSATLNNIYDEIVHWRRNLFKVPSGKQGKSFVPELTRLFQSYADQSALEGVALKAAMSLLNLLEHQSQKITLHSLKREWVIGMLAILRLFLKKIGPFNVDWPGVRTEGEMMMQGDLLSWWWKVGWERLWDYCQGKGEGHYPWQWCG